MDKTFKPQLLTVRIDDNLIYGSARIEEVIDQQLRKEAEKDLKEMGL